MTEEQLERLEQWAADALYQLCPGWDGSGMKTLSDLNGSVEIEIACERENEDGSEDARIRCYTNGYKLSIIRHGHVSGAPVAQAYATLVIYTELPQILVLDFAGAPYGLVITENIDTAFTERDRSDLGVLLAVRGEEESEAVEVSIRSLTGLARTMVDAGE